MMALSGLSGLLSRKGVMELALFGEPITSSRAVETGLVNEICKNEEVLNLAIKRAKKLAEFNPTAIALCKKLYAESEALTYKKRLESGLNMLISLLKSDDAAEALTAIEEDRKPRWKYK
jgi:enoyl-CoA hydratase/carnithine racemase